MVGNAKKWDEAKRRYRINLKMEKRLSEHTVEAYMRDVEQFYAFLQRWWDVPPGKVETTMIRRYMAWLFDRERAKTTQARSLSGIRSFFNFLLVEGGGGLVQNEHLAVGADCLGDLQYLFKGFNGTGTCDQCEIIAPDLDA